MLPAPPRYVDFAISCSPRAQFCRKHSLIRAVVSNDERSKVEMVEALQQIKARVEAGTDAWVSGAPDPARHALDAATAELDGLATVIPVTATAGELSLSSLIAQISGHADLGGQDDAVLELGFGRLTGPGRTILVLNTPHGASRSALRYLQHVRRQAPRLNLIVLASAALEATLQEPGLAALHGQLRAAPPITAAAERAQPMVTAVKPELPILVMPACSPPRRFPVVWAASALGAAVAAVSIGWLAHGATRPSIRMPLQAAMVPLAPLAEAAAPIEGAASVPALAEAAPPAQAIPVPGGRAEPTIPPWQAASLPALLSLAPPVTAAATPLPPLPQPTRASPSGRPVTRHDESVRVARSRPAWQPAPYQARARYDWETPDGEPTPDERRREDWAQQAERREWRYRGTYAFDPYGMRVFRYDP